MRIFGLLDGATLAREFQICLTNGKPILSSERNQTGCPDRAHQRSWELFRSLAWQDMGVPIIRFTVRSTSSLLSWKLLVQAGTKRKRSRLNNLSVQEGFACFYIGDISASYTLQQSRWLDLRGLPF